LALTAAYTKFRRMTGSMKLCHRSRSPMCIYCYLIVTPVDFTGKTLKAYNFVISGWVKSLQVLKRNSAYHSSDVYSTPSFVLKSGQARASIRSRTICGLLYRLTERC